MSDSSEVNPTTPIAANLRQRSKERIKNSITDFLTIENIATNEGIENNVQGRRQTKLEALRDLISQGKILRLGSGTKRDPFQYCLTACGPSYPPASAEPEIYEEVI